VRSIANSEKSLGGVGEFLGLSVVLPLWQEQEKRVQKTNKIKRALLRRAVFFIIRTSFKVRLPISKWS
jgi:hypothetical protein